MSGTWGDVGNIFEVPSMVPVAATRQLLWMEDVLMLPSARAARPGQTAADVMMTRDIGDSYYQRIMGQMEQDGINRFPVCVAAADTLDCWHLELGRTGRLAFGGGHHRLRMAAELGWTRIMATDSLIDHQLGIAEMRQMHRFFSRN